MKFRIGRYTRDIFLKYIHDRYGEFLTKIALIPGKNITDEITKIIKEYSKDIANEYDVEIRNSSSNRVDYTVLLMKKRKGKKKIK